MPDETIRLECQSCGVDFPTTRAIAIGAVLCDLCRRVMTCGHRSADSAEITGPTTHPRTHTEVTGLALDPHTGALAPGVSRRVQDHPVRPSTAAPGRHYVLPGAVLTDFGVWEYVPCTPEQARAWLEAAPYVSCLGDNETAMALTRLVELDVPKGRWRLVRLQAEDDALVFVLAREELGWLKRLA